MQPEPAGKRFDCVAYMRRERDRISAEIATMDHRELVQMAALLSLLRPPRSSASPTGCGQGNAKTASAKRSGND